MIRAISLHHGTSAAATLALLAALVLGCEGDPVAERPSASVRSSDAPLSVNAASTVSGAEFTQEQREAAWLALGEAPLEGGLSSLDELGERVVAGLNAGELEALEALLVTGEEYKQRLFLTLANHPSALTFGADASWDMTSRETRDDLRSSLHNLGQQKLTFVRIEPPASEERRGLTLHRRPKLFVRTATGEEVALAILGSVVEHHASGTFKLLSYRDAPWRPKAAAEMQAPRSGSLRG
jgi:hypothetical protein